MLPQKQLQKLHPEQKASEAKAEVLEARAEASDAKAKPWRIVYWRE